MGRKKENTGFICNHCGAEVVPLTNGSYRNHCPECLYSLHVDVNPGDRANDCKGLMAPIGITQKKKKGYQIIHKCNHCGAIQFNKLACDTFQPDSLEEFLKLMRR